MAGVAGRSGGARANSGGARPGAGRKPKAEEPAPQIPGVEGQTPLEFLLAVQNNAQAPLKDRIRSAIAAAQYQHTKRHDGGKKEDAADKAKKASKAFEPSAPPKLAVAGGKRL